MTVTNNLRTQYDLPVWEWCRPAVALSNANGDVMCASDNYGNQRYIYYNLSITPIFYRYDTYSDSWQQLATQPLTSSGVASMYYTSYQGWQTKCISSISSTQFQCAAVFSQALTGTTVRIVGGTGAGQTNTVTYVGDVIVADNGVPTAVSSSSITDTTKAWTINQWVGYQVRIILGTGTQQIRKIIYNSATILTVADSNLSSFDNQANLSFATALSVTAGSQSQYVIESSIVTVNSAWTTNPDNTSKLQFLTGGIWLICNQNAGFYLQYYDIASDSWFIKTNMNFTSGVALTGDVGIVSTNEAAGAFLSSTSTGSNTSTSLKDTTQSLTLNRYANYAIKITAGTGIGQVRSIIANTSTAFYVTRNWDVTPDATSQYSIYGDFDKIWMIGNINASANLLQYSIEADFWSMGKQLDWGVTRIGSVSWSGVNQYPIAISSFTFVTTTGTITTAINHNFKIGQTITTAGCTGVNAAIYNNTFTITAVTATTITVTLSSTPTANAVYTTTTTTTLIDASKNWATNSLAGLCVCYLTGAAVLTTGSTTFFCALISSNTSNTLTFPAQTTAPPNGTGRYVIYDFKSLGVDVIQGAETLATNGYGIATGGSTTTLVDSTKTWATNQWTGRKFHIISGTGAGGIITITSNTSTTLTYAVQVFTPDITTVYRICDAFGYVTSGTTTSITDSTQNWVTNQWTGQYVKITTGTGFGVVTTITSNTGSVLTVPTITAPALNSTYSILSQSGINTGSGLIWASGTTDSTTKGQYLFYNHSGASSLWTRYNISSELAVLISTSPFFETLSTGSMLAYDGGNRIYFENTTNMRCYYYDCILDQIIPSSTLPYNSGTAFQGNRMVVVQTVDGINYLYFQKHSLADFFRVLIFW